MSAGELVLVLIGAGCLGIGAVIWLQRHHGHVARRMRERQRQIDQHRRELEGRKHNGSGR